MPTRRSLLVGTLAGAGLLVAGCSGPDGPTAGTSVSGSFESRYRRQETGWTIVRPPGHARGALPVLVVLHGRGGDHRTAYTSLHLDEVLARLVAHGGRPFALASVDGGDHDYWHPRTTTDPAGMVLHEFLPLLVRHGLRATTRDRIGLHGWSMGGYGALYLSTVLRRARVAVVVAESPAIWHEAGQTVEGSFDGAADFRAHELWGRQADLRGIALRIDCGDRDGFAPVTRDLRATLTPTPAGGIEPGGHDATYWRSQAAAQLAFVAAHLT